MAKTQEELNALKEEVETLNKKLAELTEEELAQVTGGYFDDCLDCPNYNHIRQCKKAKGMGLCPHGHKISD